jgi:magnesium chelatase subunit I
MIINEESKGYSRIGDLIGIVPSITGKIELVYEGEQEGAAIVAQKLISKATRTIFTEYFPNPEKIKRNSPENPYREITQWFSRGNSLDLINDVSKKEYRESLDKVPGLSALVKECYKKAEKAHHYLLMEFVLHGLAEFSLLGKAGLVSGQGGVQFKDLLSGMLNIPGMDDEDDDFGGYYEKG